MRALLLVLLAGPAPAMAEGVELGFLNVTYTGLDSGLEPIREGPLTISLSSPEHRLTVYSSRLTLQPIAGDAPGGRFAARLEIELDGEGRLIADVEGAGARKRFADEVTASRQTVVATGEVTVEAVADGFLFTLEKPGPAVALEIQSALAGQIVGLCRALAVLPLFDLGCDSLERGLSVARIPMPKPGTPVLLRYAVLSESEREALEAMVAAGT